MNFDLWHCVMKLGSHLKLFSEHVLDDFIWDYGFRKPFVFMLFFKLLSDQLVVLLENLSESIKLLNCVLKPEISLCLLSGFFIFHQTLGFNLVPGNEHIFYKTNTGSLRKIFQGLIVTNKKR